MKNRPTNQEMRKAWREAGTESASVTSAREGRRFRGIPLLIGTPSGGRNAGKTEANRQAAVNALQAGRRVFRQTPDAWYQGSLVAGDVVWTEKPADTADQT